MSNKELVIYHAFCTDGLAAAIAHRIAYERDPQFKDSTTPRNALDKYDYLSMSHGYLEQEKSFLEDVEAYDHVWFLDFAPTESLLRQMLLNEQKVTIIDHHKSSYEMIKNKFYCEDNKQLRVIFSLDNKLSGATLAWVIGLQHFNIHATEQAEVREVEVFGHKFLTNLQLYFIKENALNYKDPLYNYIGIRDVWDESNPEMKLNADALHAYFVYAGLRSFDKFYDFVKNETFVHNSASIIEAGKMILELNKRNCESALNDCYQATIETLEGPIEFVMGICPDDQGSQFGQSWGDKHPGKKTISAAIFMNFNKGTVTLGFRSRNIDALRLAESFPNGGGHATACGCRITDINITLPFEPSSEDGNVDIKSIHTPAEFIRSLCVMMHSRIKKVYGKVTHGTDSKFVPMDID